MAKVIRFVDGGENQVWPEVPGYHLDGLEGSQPNQFPDWYAAVEYQSNPGDGEPRFVEFHNSKEHDGRGGSYEITTLGHVSTGEFSSLAEIPRILSKAKALSASLLKTLEAPFQHRPGWTALDYDIDIFMRYDGAPESNYSLSVKFESPEEVIFGKKTKRALVEFDLDELRLKRQALSYGSKADIQRVLREAERLFEKWSAEEA